MALARSVVWLYQISVRCVSSAPGGKVHLSAIPNISDVAVSEVTAGGKLVLPCKFVSNDVAGSDDTFRALTARTLAMYCPE
ncbi:hypothetical protein ALP64_204893 [Pseudomonas syringae pv. actinidiae]|nr:hypothetical protein ALP64_204893 [Pseudomonas syringae pv. actinidiae]